MSNENNLYSKDLYDKEMEMIDSELADIENLYVEIKTHFDGIKNNPARGSLTFLKDQTSNLISLKNAKLSYIKQRADMKRSITDFAFKEKASNKQDSDVDTITEAIYNKIASEFKYTPDKTPNNESNQTNNNDDMIDSLLDEELNDESIEGIIACSTSVENVEVDYSVEDKVLNESSDEEIIEEEIQEETIAREIVKAVDTDTGIFYELDAETYETIDELGAIETIIDEIEIDGDQYAIGESGETYLIITIEDDDED